MRLLVLVLLGFAVALSIRDGIGRVTSLVASIPERGQLVQQLVEVEGHDVRLFCSSLRHGGKSCRWEMVLLVEDGRIIRLFLEPLLQSGDERYALLQPGDKLRLGLSGDIAYTLERLSAENPLPGLAPSVTLLGEAQLREWRADIVWRGYLWLAVDLVVLFFAFRTLKRVHLAASGVLCLSCTVLLMVVSVWGWRPGPLPKEHELIDQPITAAAVGTRLSCRAARLGSRRHCEPQQFIADSDGKIWPIAYPGTSVLTPERGRDLLLGTRFDVVYRIKNAPNENSERNCSFRQHPLSRERKIVWMCDDDAAERYLRAREPVKALVDRLPGVSKLDPLPFEWTRNAYRQARAAHNDIMFFGMLLPLGAWLFWFLYRNGASVVVKGGR